jgi:hypothetical protein
MAEAASDETKRKLKFENAPDFGHASALLGV